MTLELGIEELYLSPRRRGPGIPKVSGALQDLVRRFGPLQPVVVRKTDAHRYEILLNPETWLAAQRAGYHRVPVVVRDAVSDAEADALLRLKVPESPIRIAKRCAQRLDARPDGRARGAITELAREEGCSRAHLAHLLRLLKLPELIQNAVHVGALNLGQAKALLSCTGQERQTDLALRAIQERWSVRQTEEAARNITEAGQGGEARAEAEARLHEIQRLERGLSEQLGSPVRLDHDAGVLVIDYRRNIDVLQGVLERLGYRADA